MSIKDGGPAFPCPETERVAAHDGMSLRDYAALQYAQGAWRFNRTHDEVVAEALAFADAFIKGRGHE